METSDKLNVEGGNTFHLSQGRGRLKRPRPFEKQIYFNLPNTSLIRLQASVISSSEAA
jgi:hypothetical protein